MTARFMTLLLVRCGIAVTIKALSILDAVRASAARRAPQAAPQRHDQSTELALDRADVHSAASRRRGRGQPAVAQDRADSRQPRRDARHLWRRTRVHPAGIRGAEPPDAAMSRRRRHVLAAPERLLPLRDLRCHRPARSDRAVPAQPPRRTANAAAPPRPGMAAITCAAWVK